jgi:hypothetical protein
MAICARFLIFHDELVVQRRSLDDLPGSRAGIGCGLHGAKKSLPFMRWPHYSATGELIRE